MKAPVLVAVALAVVASIAAVGRWEKRQQAKLRRVDDAEYMQHLPAGVTPDAWRTVRERVARILGLDAERLDPGMTLEALAQHFTWMGIASIDVDHVIEGLPRGVPTHEIESARTEGDLLALCAQWGLRV